MTGKRPGPVRRAGRYLLDTFAMGGTARAGFGDGRRLLQSRPVMDAMLETVTFEDQQSERTRAIWSTVGAVILGGLGLATMVIGLGTRSNLAMIAGAAEIVVGLLVMKSVVGRATQGSLVHLAGIAVLAATTYVSILTQPPLFGSWEVALPALAATIAAVVCLVVGRRG